MICVYYNDINSFNREVEFYDEIDMIKILHTVIFFISINGHFAM